MSTYCITFRIAEKTVGAATYADRRQSLINAVHCDNGYWEESTSFILATSDLDTQSFANLAAKGLSQADDKLVVFDPSDMSLAYFGDIRHPDALSSFFNIALEVGQ